MALNNIIDSKAGVGGVRVEGGGTVVNRSAAFTPLRLRYTQGTLRNQHHHGNGAVKRRRRRAPIPVVTTKPLVFQKSSGLFTFLRPTAGALRVLIGLCLAFMSLAVLSQEENGNRQSVALRDPSQPPLVKVNVMNGSIHVKVHEGQNVIVESRPINDSPIPDAAGIPKALKVEASDNVVSVSTSPLAGAVDLYIQVPVKSSLKLACLQAGEIVVEKVQGEIEASGLNGSVRLLDVSGVVLANTLNGQVKVTFQRVVPDKPMSFSTLNGDVDVTLPANTKANVSLEALNGRIESDFEIQPRGAPGQTGKAGVTGSAPDPIGAGVWTTEKVRSGTINGGGPEYRLKAFNGTIHLRKKGK